MKIKRYVVKEMHEAIKLIKQDLGPEAVIVSSYRVPPKGFIGFFMPRLLEVTAALDEQQDPGRRVKKLPLKLTATGGNRISKLIKAPETVLGKPDTAEDRKKPIEDKKSLMEILESVEAAAQSDLAENTGTAETADAGADFSAILSGIESAALAESANQGADFPEWTPALTADPDKTEAFDMAEVGPEVMEILSEAAATSSEAQPDTGREIHSQLFEEIIEQESPEAAEIIPIIKDTVADDISVMDTDSDEETGFDTSIVTVADTVQPEAPARLSLVPAPAAPGSSLFGLMVKHELTLADNLDKWRQSLLDMDVDDNVVDMLLSDLQEGTAVDLDNPEGVYMSVRKKAMELLEPAYQTVSNPRIMTFVGPTGVGKTTTLAKIATLLSINEQKTVALVTVQSYRLGASEQLREYGDLLDVPTEVAMTPDELVRAIEKHSDKDYILIDTAGRSARNSGMLLELRSFIKSVQEPHDVYLVMSITTKNRELHRTVREYLRVGCSKLIFTKLDETDAFGSILNIVISHGLPATYLTDGQVIPDNISEAGPRSISELLLRGINR
ncbi:MAG: AAA family ATPase [Peptococcaceae bacterium]|nr:AAA family ATPase [Peptococcaceae bacterium]